MPRPLHAVSKRRAARMSAVVAETAQALGAFSTPVLTDLLRRLEGTSRPDGWPAQSPGADSPTVATSGDSSPVERAVGRRLARPSADPVAETAESLMRHLRTAHQEAQAARRLLEVVRHSDEGARERQSTVTSCDVCGALITCQPGDRPRLGLCPACYSSWTTWRGAHPSSSDPVSDRRRWAQDRKARLAAHEPPPSASAAPAGSA